MAAAEGRNPLPGDREAAERDGEHDTERSAEISEAQEGSLGDGRVKDDGDEPGPEFRPSDPFDEDESREMTAGLDEAPDPVGAMV